MALESNRKIFLVISTDQERIETISAFINKYYSSPTIYSANKQTHALSKLSNANVDIILVDDGAKGINCLRLVEDILLEGSSKNAAIMIFGVPPEQEKFLDEIVIGKISFLNTDFDEKEFSSVLAKALNFSSISSNNTNFNLRYLSPGEILMKEGEEAKCVYIVKSGELCAYFIKDGNKNFLGTIHPGEFVGEMAYINKERRSAFIEATTMSELIEIPFGLVEKIIFSRPSWSKALIQTLSKRLKNVNKLVMEDN